uniref:Gfo/Idh/MocA-like oxidoreductase N-terminal domain-containing protein n=1 Tax=Eucampia antarctica TaxID=49252 RepID=A0A7S2RZX5_9STRA|mmetsp:Transcript_29065/g.27960  ORF Transcript_29065/g.27960 Transcript_29065/m.27960 type:complete len:337 (+) Transcript_29065:236-1246(+)|eukprot:CAMPEP_0197831076 /NCGR_PEP_ID=MMETSP1437-20131217/7673_1 /TAXON_ID=49252 ORGANISM="Eucampia antarctica, Strain CCMP1452" /NCGR_SAMPLE_ID=MMETSP1437 /ASSEMBLY_ACC=CAM_ASM_001096 /LENGTH=336 /DNA_ID=CAMNT_0043433837 /DNA_START=169 /DNA_END=1179 /DNA_ORIENTATION=+
MSLNRARVALVGTGRMGQIRAAILYSNPRFDLCGIIDKKLDSAKMLATKYRAKPFESIDEAITHFGRSNAIDGIVLSSPTFTHDAVIREAANHGLAIFTEKPVDETANKITSLFEFCQEKQAELCCGFQRRFDNSYVTTALAVKEGRIGKPITANIFFADHPSPPIDFMLSGGNIFFDLCAHDVDYIRWLFDDEVVSVYATGTSSDRVLDEAGVYDNATMIFKFRKGMVVTINLSRSASYGYDQRCEVFGSSGLLTIGNEHANTSVLSNDYGIHQAKLKHSFPERYQQAFASELDAFADVILLGNKWPVRADDCIAVQKVADAARKSCEIDKVVYI